MTTSVKVTLFAPLGGETGQVLSHLIARGGPAGLVSQTTLACLDDLPASAC